MKIFKTGENHWVITTGNGGEYHAFTRSELYAFTGQRGIEPAEVDQALAWMEEKAHNMASFGVN